MFVSVRGESNVSTDQINSLCDSVTCSGPFRIRNSPLSENARNRILYCVRLKLQEATNNDSILCNMSRIGHVLNEQGTGYEHIFSWYEHSISIELKMGHVI